MLFYHRIFAVYYFHFKRLKWKLYRSIEVSQAVTVLATIHLIFIAMVMINLKKTPAVQYINKVTIPLVIFIPSLVIYIILDRYFTKNEERCSKVLQQFEQLPGWEKTAWEFVAAILLVAPFVWMLVLAFYSPVK